ncbi:MAG: hypothetical protein E6J34_16925 [Chloroflexi bacterium]|nr:MAG: hypothetical protein E6J34_16925 [Chloroflexota bacterium]
MTCIEQFMESAVTEFMEQSIRVEGEGPIPKVVRLICDLIVDEAKRKKAGKIQLTTEELVVFRQAGVREGRITTTHWLAPCSWAVRGNVFC